MRPAARFTAVLRTGETNHSGGITVIRTSAEIGPPQVGIVASRRVGNAVKRNRAKRRLREAMMRIELQPDTAYVVVAPAGAVGMEFDELTRRLREAVDRGNEGKQR
ncbi:MAG: ribonuclease P protein component [Acidimicrobiia bacterium]